MTFDPSTDPMLADLVGARSLSGLSGASVSLATRDGSHWFVRKAAGDAAGGARLRRQFEKQRSFAPLPGIRAPSILEHGERDGRFYFDMEYVRGTDGISYLRRATYAAVGEFADRLCAYLDATAARTNETATLAPSPFDALYTKICDVHRRTRALDGDTLARLFLGLERLRAIDLVATPCHGDLTLENIVIDGDGVFWLLDFLDPPFEHWWQDVAKLHQDLEGGWYLGAQPPVARGVLDYVSRRVMATASACTPSYPEVHAVMLACTFVRILPYARSSEQLSLVLERVQHFARIASPDR